MTVTEQEVLDLYRDRIAGGWFPTPQDDGELVWADGFMTRCTAWDGGPWVLFCYKGKCGAFSFAHFCPDLKALFWPCKRAVSIQ